MSAKKVKNLPLIILIFAICTLLVVYKVSGKSDDELYQNNNSDVEINRDELIDRLKYCNDMYIFVTGGNSVNFCENYPISAIYDNELEYCPVRANVASDTDEIYKKARNCFSQNIISNSELRKKMFNPGGKTKVEILRKKISDCAKSIGKAIKGLFSDDTSNENEYEITYYPLFTMINGELAYLQETPPIFNSTFYYDDASMSSCSQNKVTLNVSCRSNIDSDSSVYSFNMIRVKTGEWKIDSVKAYDGKSYYEK